MGGGDRPPPATASLTQPIANTLSAPHVHFCLDHVYVPSPEDPNGEVQGYLSLITQDPKVGIGHLVAWTPHYMLRSLNIGSEDVPADYVAVSSGLNPPPEGIASTYAMVMSLPSFRSIFVQSLPDGVKVTPRIAGGIPLQPFVVRGPDPESSTNALIAAIGSCVDIARSPTNPDIYVLETPQSSSSLLLPPFAPSVIENTNFDPTKDAKFTKGSSSDNFPNIIPEMNLDPVFNAVEEAKWTILERFSRVTQFYKSATSLILSPHPDRRPASDSARSSSSQFPRQVSTSGTIQMEPATSAETEIGSFEILSSERTPPPMPSQRSPSLMITSSVLKGLKDQAGRVLSESDFRRRVFFGGCTQDTRAEVWKFLLGYYPFSTTEEERVTLVAQKRALYETYKRQWLTITPDQEAHFSRFKENRHRIEKDVLRTDRTHPAFADENGPMICRLRDILLTYTFYNFDLGYVQGMSDLLVPILLVLEPHPNSYNGPVSHPSSPSPLECDAFWMFVALMDVYQTHFFRDQKGMHRNLGELKELVRFLDPELYCFLEVRNANTFFFCFRWLLILFKREFPVGEPLLLVWDALLSKHLSKRFHVFLSAGALIAKRRELMSPSNDFDEMLQYINNLAGNIDAESFLRRGEETVYTLLGRQDAPDELRKLAE